MSLTCLLVVLFLFAGYSILSEFRLFRVIKQRNYWHKKYTDLAEWHNDDLPPEDYLVSEIIE